MAQETPAEQEVTYVLEMNGRVFVVENVPARVSLETGERFFSPATVERLQQTIWGQAKPSRMVETPVFEFATLSVPPLYDSLQTAGRALPVLRDGEKTSYPGEE